MDLTVKRDVFNADFTLGKLYVDGQFFCYTCEDEIRPAGQKVYGETAIPAGTYDIHMTYSPKYKRVMPLIVDVPGFEGIRIHTGNSDDDTNGCLLVGYGRTPSSITQSRDAFAGLYEILRMACLKGRVMITVS